MQRLTEFACRTASGAFEVRSTLARVSDVCDDVRRFVNGTNLPVDQASGTPTNGVLLHMFGIITNALLAQHQIPQIPGPDWSFTNAEGAEIVQGLIKIGYSSNFWLDSVHQNSDDCWVVNPRAIINNSSDGIFSNVITEEALCSYPTEREDTMFITLMSVAPLDLFDIRQVYGKVMVRYPVTIFKPTGPGNNNVVAGPNNLVFEITPNPSPDPSLIINDQIVHTNVWIPLNGVCRARFQNAYSGAISFQFKITHYHAPSHAEGAFLLETGCNGFVNSSLLPPIPEGDSKWKNMYRTAVRAFGVDEPSAIPARYIDKNYIDLILLLNSNLVE